MKSFIWDRYELYKNKNYLSAADPLVESSPWRCEDCASMAPSNLASEVNNRVANTIKILEENGLDPESCEKFIMVHSRILHPQHAHMLDVKVRFS